MCMPMCCILKRNAKITPRLEKQFFCFKGLIVSSELEKEIFLIQDFLYTLDPYIRHPNLHFGITFCSDYLLLLSSEKKSRIKKYNNGAILPNSLHSDNCEASSSHGNLTENIYPLCWDLCTGNGAQNYSNNLPKFWKQKPFKSKAVLLLFKCHL